MARDQGVGQSREAFLHEIFDQVEDPKPPTLGELVVHYVNRPERSNGSRRAFARDTVLEAGQGGGPSFCSCPNAPLNLPFDHRAARKVFEIHHISVAILISHF